MDRGAAVHPPKLALSDVPFTVLRGIVTPNSKKTLAQEILFIDRRDVECLPSKAFRRCGG